MTLTEVDLKIVQDMIIHFVKIKNESSKNHNGLTQIEMRDIVYKNFDLLTDKGSLKIRESINQDLYFLK